MSNIEFMWLWSDRDRERTVIITEYEEGEVTLVVSFPPDRIAIEKIQWSIGTESEGQFVRFPWFLRKEYSKLNKTPLMRSNPCRRCFYSIYVSEIFYS